MNEVNPIDIDIDGIIPDGWRIEIDPSYGVIIAAIDQKNRVNGFVTVGEKSRSFSLGINPHTNNFKVNDSYKGRGWRHRLYIDAVNSLRDILDGEGK